MKKYSGSTPKLLLTCSVLFSFHFTYLVLILPVKVLFPLETLRSRETHIESVSPTKHAMRLESIPLSPIFSFFLSLPVPSLLLFLYFVFYFFFTAIVLQRWFSSLLMLCIKRQQFVFQYILFFASLFCRDIKQYD